MNQRIRSVFEAIGGSVGVDRLVTAFYKKHIGIHDLLVPIFPEDLTEQNNNYF